MYEKEGVGRAKARELLSGAGYKSGGHFKGEARKAKTAGKIGESVAAAAVHKHEGHLHAGAPKTKFKSGGLADGGAANGRLDRAGRKKKAAHTTVNVVVGGQHDGGPPPIPPALMAAMAAKKPPMPQMPMGAQPMPGGPPPAGGPGMPPMKRGGRSGHALGGKAGAKVEAGAMSGEGRLEKAEIQKADRMKGKK